MKEMKATEEKYSSNGNRYQQSQYQTVTGSNNYSSGGQNSKVGQTSYSQHYPQQNKTTSYENYQQKNSQTVARAVEQPTATTYYSSNQQKKEENNNSKSVNQPYTASNTNLLTTSSIRY